MKFKEDLNWCSSDTYNSPEEYFQQSLTGHDYVGTVENLERKVEHLENVIGRLLNHTPLTLEQLSDVVNGYDKDLVEVDE